MKGDPGLIWPLLSINLTLLAICIELHRIAEFLKDISHG